MHKPYASSWGKALLIVFCLVLVLVTGLQVFDYFEFRPTGDGKETVEYKIEDGESLDQVLQGLEKDGLIRNANYSQIYAKIFHKDGHYAGTYSLNNGMSLKEILDYISNPQNIETKSVEFTIIPGSWAKTIAASLAEQFPHSADEILKQWNDPEYIKTLAQDYPFINPQTLNNDQLKVKLEGYLFPNTYALEKDMTIDQITRVFLDGFNAMYTANKEAFDQSGKSVEEILTLASIVQFEAANDEQMPAISGVFNNRLSQNMKLESSVTVCYALYENFSDATACETNYDIDSPYNTYLHEGLPIGPINNPGQAAVLAAIHPEENEYLFFVADINNKVDGQVHFSKTYEEHQALMEQLGLTLGE